MPDSTATRTITHLASGCVAGTVASSLTSPLDVVKTRLQTCSLRGVNSPAIRVAQAATAICPPPPVFCPPPKAILPRPLLMLRHIISHEGFSALYKGLGMTLMGIAPSRAIYFAGYANFKSLWSSVFVADDWKVPLCSALGAGLIVSTSTSPIWVVKTRLQVHPGAGASRQTVFNCVKDLYADNGIRGFYRGLSASYAGVCETAFYFVMYEHLKRHFAPVDGSEEFHSRQLVQSSVVAKCVAAVLAYPHEVVRTRLRIENGKNRKYRSFFQTLMKVWRDERLAGMYGGLSAHLCRVVPNTAIMFLVYENAVRILAADR